MLLVIDVPDSLQERSLFRNRIFQTANILGRGLFIFRICRLQRQIVIGWG